MNCIRLMPSVTGLFGMARHVSDTEVYISEDCFMDEPLCGVLLSLSAYPRTGLHGGLVLCSVNLVFLFGFYRTWPPPLVIDIWARVGTWTTGACPMLALLQLHSWCLCRTTHHITGRILVWKVHVSISRRRSYTAIARRPRSGRLSRIACTICSHSRNVLI